MNPAGTRNATSAVPSATAARAASSVGASTMVATPPASSDPMTSSRRTPGELAAVHVRRRRTSAWKSVAPGEELAEDDGEPQRRDDRYEQRGAVAQALAQVLERRRGRRRASGPALLGVAEGAAGEVEEDGLEVRLDELHAADVAPRRPRPPRAGGAAPGRRRPTRISSTPPLAAAAATTPSTAGGRGDGRADVAGDGQPDLRPRRPMSATSSRRVPSARISPRVDDPDPVAEALGLLHVVGRVQDRHALPARAPRSTRGSRSGSAGRRPPSARRAAAGAAGGAARCRC